MLRYDRQTKPGLVALYDIRPGNGAGPFLQPRSPHGADQGLTHPPIKSQTTTTTTICFIQPVYSLQSSLQVRLGPPKVS